MKLRLYQPEDKVTCLAIFESNRPKYFMPEERQQFEDWLDKPGREVYYLLEDQGEVVACGGLYEDTDLKLIGLAWGMVYNHLHQQGYGKALTLHRVEEMSRRFPHYKQVLGTSQHTAPFYQKMGFTTIEVTKDGFGPGLDHYRMVRVRI